MVATLAGMGATWHVSWTAGQEMMRLNATRFLSDFEADFLCDLEQVLALSGRLFFTLKTKGFETPTEALPDLAFQNGGMLVLRSRCVGPLGLQLPPVCWSTELTFTQWAGGLW